MSVNITTVFQPTVTITVSDSEYAGLLKQGLVYSVDGGPPILPPVLPPDVSAEINKRITLAYANIAPDVSNSDSSIGAAVLAVARAAVAAGGGGGGGSLSYDSATGTYSIPASSTIAYDPATGAYSSS